MRITESKLRQLIRQVLIERKSNYSQEMSDLLSSLDFKKSVGFGGGGGGNNIDDGEGNGGGGENEKEVLKKKLIKMYLDLNEEKWSECSDNIFRVIVYPILKKIKLSTDISTLKRGVSNVNAVIQGNANVVVNLLGSDVDLENYSDKKSKEYKILMRHIELIFILDVNDWLDIFENVCKRRNCKEDIYNVSKALNSKIKEIM